VHEIISAPPLIDHGAGFPPISPASDAGGDETREADSTPEARPQNAVRILPTEWRLAASHSWVPGSWAEPL
jgi:hypothetical protein